MKYVVVMHLVENPLRRIGSFPPNACMVTRITNAESMKEALDKFRIGDDCVRVEIFVAHDHDE